MDRQAGYRVETRAWLLWGVAATLPLLTGRHPVVLVELLMIATIVRTTCLPFRQGGNWDWLLRIAALAIPIGVVFNLMTVHAGSQAIVTLPEDIPLFGGVLTWNAALYGLLSGLAIVALVAVGTTLAALIEWSAMIRLLPARAGTLAVAGTVAWAFLPQLALSWREIRETQAARGHRWRGMRDLVPLMVPLLAGGLDRSIATAESLEARGFGALAHDRSLGLRSSVAMVVALTTMVAGLYLFASGAVVLALALISAAVITGLAATWQGSSSKTTHYRCAQWHHRDTFTAAGATVAMIATIAALRMDTASLRYDPYPDIGVPALNPLLLLALAALLTPAFAMATKGDALGAST